MALFDRSMEIEPEPPRSTPAEHEAAAPYWGLGKRILFRFTFSYLVLYLLSIFPVFLEVFPGGEAIIEQYQAFLTAVLPWAGRHLLGVDVTVHPSGSGDTMADWVQVFCILVLALASTVVWSLLDRRRTQYARLYEWLRVGARFGLGLTMIVYGGSKIVPSQFPPPPLDRLMQPFGDASPMGLLWTFMGASAPYTIFAGLAEWLGGVLLLFRRTTLLGALVSIGALTNVVMLNFCYDVPVKLFSSHLLAMALFLAAHDLRRLANLLVLNRPAPAAPDPRLVQRRGLRSAALAFQVVLAIGFSASIINLSWHQLHDYTSARSPLRGVWNVEELQADGQAGPPPGAEALQWHRLIFDYPTMVTVQLTSDSRQRYGLKLDEARKTLVLTKRGDPASKSSFKYQRPAPDRLTLEGTLGGHKIRASLHQAEESKFLLITRGFHWVSEYPFNR
ncbi:MAG TPA: hypothetical protein VFR03_15050 [Thermoanaerobaculia bacterium]|nr:hypothetical protein [Thermoanaerobaculia bacterium]